MNVKALVGAFNQEKDLIGAFYVILKTDGSFAAVVGVYHDTGGGGAAQLPIHRPHPATRASAVTGTCCTLHTPSRRNMQTISTAFIAAIKNCVNFHSFFIL